MMCMHLYRDAHAPTHTHRNTKKNSDGGDESHMLGLIIDSGLTFGLIVVTLKS